MGVVGVVTVADAPWYNVLLTLRQEIVVKEIPLTVTVGVGNINNISDLFFYPN